MSKNIAISDEVYERLKREKGDRSFSEVIADRLDAGGHLIDVTGAGIFSEETMADVNRELDRLSENTMTRIRSESHEE